MESKHYQDAWNKEQDLNTAMQTSVIGTSNVLANYQRTQAIKLW